MKTLNVDFDKRDEHDRVPLNNLAISVSLGELVCITDSHISVNATVELRDGMLVAKANWNTVKFK